MIHPTNPDAVCVKREGGKGYHWVSNYDPKVHKKVDPPKPAEPDEAALADPLNIPSASEEAVAESIEPAPVAAPAKPKRKRKVK